MVLFIPALIAGASFVLEAGSRIAEHQAKKRQARENRRAAREARTLAMGDLAIRSSQERQATALESDRVRRQAEESAGLSRASAASSGVAGMSLDLLLQDTVQDRSEALGILEQNLQFTQQQIGRSRRGVAAQERSRRAQSRDPNPFVTGLQIGESALRNLGPHIPGVNDPAGVEV